MHVNGRQMVLEMYQNLIPKRISQEKQNLIQNFKQILLHTTTPSSPWKSNVNKCSLSSADERSFSNGCCHSKRTLPVLVAFPPLVTESVGSLYNVKPCS